MEPIISFEIVFESCESIKFSGELINLFYTGKIKEKYTIHNGNYRKVKSTNNFYLEMDIDIEPVVYFENWKDRIILKDITAFHITTENNTDIIHINWFGDYYDKKQKHHFESNKLIISRGIYND